MQPEIERERDTQYENERFKVSATIKKIAIYTIWNRNLNYSCRCFNKISLLIIIQWMWFRHAMNTISTNTVTMFMFTISAQRQASERERERERHADREGSIDSWNLKWMEWTRVLPWIKYTLTQLCFEQAHRKQKDSHRAPTFTKLNSIVWLGSTKNTQPSNHWRFHAEYWDEQFHAVFFSFSLARSLSFSLRYFDSIDLKQYCVALSSFYVQMLKL